MIQPPLRTIEMIKPHMHSKSAPHAYVGLGKVSVLTLTSLVFVLFGLFSGQSWAGRVNFASYQSVIASGQTGDYDPSFAVDGLVSNFHSFRTSNTSNPQWLQVNFPRSVTIGSAHLYVGLDNDASKGGLPSFKIQSYNGSAWVDVPGTSVTGNTATELSIIFSAATTSDQFRLYTDENGSRTIREFALFPPHVVGSAEQGYPIGTDVRLSLAFKRPAAASSINTTYYPKLAVDGHVDDTSRWLCSNVTGQTLELDLLDTNVLGSVHLYSGFGTGGALGSFTLESWNGTGWDPIPGATFTANTSTALVIPFSSNVTTSRIRLRTTVATPARVRELLVFPPRAGGYPLGQDVQISAPPSSRWDDFSDSSWRLKNGGPDLRLASVNGQVVHVNNSSGSQVLDWQLLLNHRDGSYRLRHVATGNCLAQAEISNVTGKSVVVESYTGMPHQDWFLDYLNATQFRLINAYSGLAVYPNHGVWDAGTPMVLATPGSSILQLWQRSLSANHPKKGLAGYVNSYDKFNVSWSYNWGRSNSVSLPFDHQFNPMQWGDYNWSHGANQGPVDLIRDELQAGPKPVHVMGFNEPDRTDQANMTTDRAIALWPRLEALDAPLIGPCPASPLGSWAMDWEAKADAQGFRRDYTPVHWYDTPNVDQLVGVLTNAYNTFGRPVWLTEFSTVSWSGTGNWSDADNYNFLAEFMWRAQSISWLKRYSLFQFTEGTNPATDPINAPRSNALKSDGTLTAFGELYAGWDGVTSIVANKKYHFQNRGGYDRLQNPGGTAGPALVVPENSGIGTRWFLTPGTTANTYRITSTRDGRLLSSNGSSVSLAAASLTTNAVEWRLVANQDGWYFIEHPATSKRLRDNDNGTFSMVATSTTTDLVKWRFVVPAVAENVAPVLAAIPARTVTEGGSLSFIVSATDPDLPAQTLTYSLIGSPSGASIDPATGLFTWTPSEAQGPGTYNFSVRVSDGALTSDQPVAATVNEVNAAPVLATIPAQTINEGALFTFTASTSDPDLPSNTLTYSLIGAPTGAAIDASSGVFTWSPTEAQGPASFNFILRVSDGALTCDQSVDVLVNEVNLPPVLAAIPAKNVFQGLSLSFSASAVDDDLPSNTLTYSLIGAPPGAAIDPGTGAFSWTPTNSQGPATFNFTVRVSDGSLTADRPVAVTVSSGRIATTFSYQQGDLRKDGVSYGSGTSYNGVIDGQLNDNNTTSVLSTTTAISALGNAYQASPAGNNGRQYVGMFAYNLTELNNFIAANTSATSSVTVTSVAFNLVSAGGNSGSAYGIRLYGTEPFTSTATWLNSTTGTPWSQPYQSLAPPHNTAQFGYTGGGSALTASLGGTNPNTSVPSGNTLQWTSSANFIAALNSALARTDKTIYLTANVPLNSGDNRLNVNYSSSTTVENRPELVIGLEITAIIPPATWRGTAGSSWTAPGNWSTNAQPIAGASIIFDSTSAANLETVLNQDFDVLGVTLTNPPGPVSIAGTNTLTIGNGGIDLSAAIQNLGFSAPIILGSAQTWNIASGRTLAISGAVSGSANLTLTGAGKLSAGAVNVLPTGAGAGNLTVNGGLDLNGFSQSINGLSGSGVIDNAAVGPATLTLGNNNTSCSFNGVIRNTGGTLMIRKIGNGTLTLSASNSFSGGFANDGAGDILPQSSSAFGSGPIVINAGQIYSTTSNFSFSNFLNMNGATLRVGGGGSRSLNWTGPVSVTADSGISADGGTSGVTISGNVNVVGSTLSSYANGTTNTISGTISGAGGKISITGGTLNLTGTNSYTGGTTLAGGTLSFSAGGLGSTGGIIMDGGALQWRTGNSLDVSSRLVMVGGKSCTLDTNGNTVTFASPIGDSTTAGLVKSGTGTLILSAANTYNGPTTVNGGTLRVGSSGSLSTVSSVVVSGGTLSGTGTLGGSVTVAAAGSLDPGPGVGMLTIGGGLNISAPANGGSGKLRFDLDAPSATSDRIAVTGALVIGNGALGFNDFVFTNLGGLRAGFYKLITSSGISPGGTLDSSNLAGTIGPLPAALRINGNDLELVVDGGAINYDSWKSQITNGSHLRTDDADGDGFSNLQEYLYGTSPITANGSLVTTTRSGGNLVLRWLQIRIRGTYMLQQSSTLTNGSWITVSPEIPSMDLDQAGAPPDYDYFSVSLPIGNGSVFYRVVGIEN
jgi:autotransporter-associated beta strand protein